MTVDIEADFFEKVRKHVGDSEIVYNNKLRDHFAGLAMQGMLSSNHFVNNGANILSQDAYTIADAMLKQRSL